MHVSLLSLRNAVGTALRNGDDAHKFCKRVRCSEFIITLDPKASAFAVIESRGFGSVKQDHSVVQLLEICEI